MDEKTMRKIEDRVTETKSKSFCPPTNEAVVKAWEAFDKRVVAVYDPDTDVESEPGSRHFFGIGEAGDIIRGIELRKDRQTMEHDLDAWMKVSDFMGDVFPQFVNPDEDRALLLVDEWNDLMDAIAHDDEEASPDVRQAAEDQKIVALGHQYQYEGVCCQGMEVYDDTVCMDELLSLRKPNGTTSVKLYYTTPAEVDVSVYPGWDGPDEIISAGGWVDGVYIRPAEVESAGLFEKLSDEVRAELEPLAGGGDPADWNDKIHEILAHPVDPKDEELLDALWIIGEVYNDEVTIYNAYRRATYIDDSVFEDLGLHWVGFDEDDEDEDAVDYDEDAMDFGL